MSTTVSPSLAEVAVLLAVLRGLPRERGAAETVWWLQDDWRRLRPLLGPSSSVAGGGEASLLEDNYGGGGIRILYNKNRLCSKGLWRGLTEF